MRRRTIVSLIGLQVLLVLLVALPGMMVLARGQVVVLDTTPVDPRDFFRGQYVALSYPMSEIPDVFGRNVEGRTVFVPLHGDARNGWTPGTPTLSVPHGGVFIRGVITGRSFDRLLVKYGIEQFFLSEARAREVEGLVGRGLQAEVRVSRDGRAALVRLLHGGAPVSR